MCWRTIMVIITAACARYYSFECSPAHSCTCPEEQGVGCTVVLKLMTVVHTELIIKSVHCSPIVGPSCREGVNLCSSRPSKCFIQVEFSLLCIGEIHVCRLVLQFAMVQCPTWWPTWTPGVKCCDGITDSEIHSIVPKNKFYCCRALIPSGKSVVSSGFPSFAFDFG